jgi:hypothetical protein
MNVVFSRPNCHTGLAYGLLSAGKASKPNQALCSGAPLDFLCSPQLIFLYELKMTISTDLPHERRFSQTKITCQSWIGSIKCRQSIKPKPCAMFQGSTWLFMFTTVNFPLWTKIDDLDRSPPWTPFSVGLAAIQALHTVQWVQAKRQNQTMRYVLGLHLTFYVHHC